MRSERDRTLSVVIAAVAVAVLWLGLAYQLARPTQPSAYLRTVLQVAESAHDATRTGQLVGQQELAGNVTVPFATTAFDEAAGALAGAQKKFASQGPPDSASADLRDQLSPLLARSVIALGDTAEAADDRELRAGVARLTQLAGKLDDFITAHQ
ncbi:hypothetical protein [Krasilnikovia sp. M28-CT-15]|uniref:hypothetical protein n=1 Tax=Krasilnikovia sp. M28-CT-15 TaxID=3373540 RepID=UPI0038772EF5